MKTKSLVCCALIAASAFTACTTGEESGSQHRAINQPWDDVDVPQQTFTFDAERGDTILLDNGTIIRIPAGILLNAKGEHITGKVELEYREMYTAASIIASGIPMDYDSAGSNYCFQSAGMFDINASQNEEALSIENGKSISMDFATTRNDQTYSFYRYDTTANAWSFLDVPATDTNMTRLAIDEEVANAESAAPVKPVEYSAKDPVIDLDFDLDKHPELSGYNGIIWQYAGNGADPEVNNWIYQENWSRADLRLNNREQGIYALDLSNGDKSFSTFVRPVLKGDNYRKAIAEFTTRMSAFEAQEQQRRAMAEKAKDIPPFMTRLNVMVFGVHNLDCLRHNPDFAYVNTKFKFDDPSFNVDRAGVTVYIVSGEDEMTVGYNAQTTLQCYYKKGSKNKVIAVHNESGKTWVMNAAEFSAANPAGATGLTLNMKPAKDQVLDVKGLETVLDKL